MRKVDFAVQTLLFAAAICSLAAFGKEGPIVVALAQFFMGVWQLISAGITTAKINGDTDRRTIMLIYWASVILYASGFLGLYFIDKEEFFIGWFFGAWLIAIYYYIYTCKLAFGIEPKKKSFLEIVN